MGIKTFSISALALGALATGTITTSVAQPLPISHHPLEVTIHPRPPPEDLAQSSPREDLIPRHRREARLPRRGVRHSFFAYSHATTMRIDSWHIDCGRCI